MQLAACRIFRRLIAGNAAKRFRIANKGHIEPGYDADLALVDSTSSSFDPRNAARPPQAQPVRRSDRSRGSAVARSSRGTTVFQDGKIVSEPIGRLRQTRVSNDELIFGPLLLPRPYGKVDFVRTAQSRGTSME